MARRKKKTHLCLYENTWFRCLADRHIWETPTGRKFLECSWFIAAALRGESKGGCEHLAGNDCKAVKVRQLAFHIHYMKLKKQRLKKKV